MSEKITKDMSINDVIRLYPSTMGVFTGYNIDSCCGGAASLAEAAVRDAIPLKELLEMLNEAAG